MVIREFLNKPALQQNICCSISSTTTIFRGLVTVETILITTEVMAHSLNCFECPIASLGETLAGLVSCAQGELQRREGSSSQWVG